MRGVHAAKRFGGKATRALMIFAKLNPIASNARDKCGVCDAMLFEPVK